MDWKKTLNITAIGLVSWLLVIQWNFGSGLGLGVGFGFGLGFEFGFG